MIFEKISDTYNSKFVAKINNLEISLVSEIDIKLVTKKIMISGITADNKILAIGPDIKKKIENVLYFSITIGSNNILAEMHKLI